LPDGDLLWKPSAQVVERARITSYTDWLTEEGRDFPDYGALWNWSVTEIEDFWQSIWDYFEVSGTKHGDVLSSRKMPGTRWFEGSRLNYAEHSFRNASDGVALIAVDERETRRVSWETLRKDTASVAASLEEMGVKAGDRVAAYLPNGTEAVTGLLASASLGAVWSSCSPEFGAPSVIDRFRQIEPKVLIVTEGYSYGGTWYDRTAAVEKVRKALSSVTDTVVVRRAEGPNGQIPGAREWGDLLGKSVGLKFVPVEFSHPLWILYSSGTTGLPKAIVQGHGGILLEHLKVLGLHNDLVKGDRFFWFTTTGWMMWNYLVGGLLHGTSVVLYDGSPGYPDMHALWDLVDKSRVTFMGTSAAYIAACMKAGVELGSAHNLGSLRGVGSTGSPLSAEGFEWIYDAKEDVWLASISGGTDVCTGFVGGCPTLPVYSGEIQCRSLGAAVNAYDDEGRSVVGRVGELVVTEPMPSMPLFFWGDADGSKYGESYFAVYPGVWRHGDWIMIKERGTCVIFGRSDATIKRMGIRIGTSEIYRAVESMQEVAESLAIDMEGLHGKPFMILFVVPAAGVALDDTLKERIKERVKSDLSKRYVPDMIVEVSSVPRTLSGKKLEVPVKRVFTGVDPSRAFNVGSLSNPASMDQMVEMARRMRREGKL
jgi:acetoacetyl-CoA synthetase